MRRGLLLVSISVAAVLISAVTVGCNAEDDYSASQRSKIETYLTANSLSYKVTADSAYVHLYGNNLASPSEVYAAKGDSVSFNFAAYEFASSPASTPYYTNKKWLADEISTVLNTEYWNFDPIRVKIGSGSILKGIDSALPTCRAGDSLAVFLTSSLAYGGTETGVVPKNTALMIVLTILEVKK